MKRGIVELSSYFCGDMRQLAERIGGMRYDSGYSEDAFWAEYTGDGVKLMSGSGSADPNQTDWIKLFGKETPYSLFGIQVGMQRDEVFQRMQAYSRVEDYGDDDYATWCIVWDEEYYMVVLYVEFEGDTVRQVTYGWYGD